MQHESVVLDYILRFVLFFLCFIRFCFCTPLETLRFWALALKIRPDGSSIVGVSLLLLRALKT